MKNEDSHIILYAKYHYERSGNIMNDLRKICAHRCCVEERFMPDHNIAQIVLEIALPKIMVNQRNCGSFIWSVLPITGIDVHEHLVKRCLVEIMNMKIYDHDGNLILELDDPGPNILPIKNKDGK